MGITAQDEVIKVAKIAQLRKAEICAEDSGISDMQSFVVFQHNDMFECRQSGIDGHPFEALPKVLNDAYNEGKREFDTISIVVDSYFNPYKKDEPYERGTLAKDFMNNPQSEVKECLSIMTYGWSGDSAGKVITYKYNDRGLPEFSEVPDTEGAEMRSNVLDFLMNSYIEFCKQNIQSSSEE